MILVLAGWDGNKLPPLIFAAVMLVAAAGMWKLKYWAVLGFEVLLGVSFTSPSSPCSGPATSPRSRSA